MDSTTKAFEELLVLIRTLRGEGGCPWDRKQTIQTLKTYLEQEFQELMEVLEKGASEHIREEMGDLIFLLIFTAEIARDQGDFSIGDVLESVKKKMIRRHPHVFGDVEAHDIPQIKENWREIKAKEKTLCPGDSLADNLPRHLPPLLQAQWVVCKGAEAGFSWNSPPATLGGGDQKREKIRESLATTRGKDAKHAALGELLFAFFHLCGTSQVKPEEVAREFVSRFTKRCQYVERNLQEQSTSVHEASSELLAGLWEEAKEEEEKGKTPDK